MAEQLHRRGLEVTLVEAAPQILAPLDPEMAVRVRAELEAHGVCVLTSNPIVGFEEPTTATPTPNGATTGAQDSDVLLKDGQRLPADVVVLGLGVRPDTALARAAGLPVSDKGGSILVDKHLRTKGDPRVWAVGDCIEVPNPVLGGGWMVPLARPANRQGRMVADNICRSSSGGEEGVASPPPLSVYRGTLGTAALRCFRLTAASMGANKRMLREKGVPFQCVHVHPSSHARYYQGARPVALKLLWERETGRVVGAKAVGEDGVDKRVDVLAAAVQAGLTVDDVAEMELCYAPPLGNAKDPVNLVGMAAQNIRDGAVAVVGWEDLAALAADPAAVLLDVRNPGEIAKFGKLHLQARNIPLDQLRGALHNLPRDRPIVVSCMSGQRSY